MTGDSWLAKNPDAALFVPSKTPMLLYSKFVYVLVVFLRHMFENIEIAESFRVKNLASSWKRFTIVERVCVYGWQT